MLIYSFQNFLTLLSYYSKGHLTLLLVYVNDNCCAIFFIFDTDRYINIKNSTKSL